MIDIHNHVLFAVDDGSESLEESIEMLREYKRNGVEVVVFTPHVNHPMFKNDVETIKKNYDILNEECKKMGIYALLGSEVYLTPNIKDVIPINDRFVLVEVNVSTYPMYLYDKIFDLQLEGYDIILAHVERYAWLKSDAGILKKLKDMNVYFQMNVNSVKDDKFFLKNGYIDFLATDYHGKKRGAVDWEVFKTHKEMFEKTVKMLGLKVPLPE